MRDTAVDLAKAFSLLVVVGMHAMMAGVTVGAGGLVVTNTLAGHPIFAWATWGLQVMPLFFLLGGFSSITQWRRVRDQGATSGEYIRQRVHRLARPAVLPIALVGGTLALLTLTDISPELLSQVGFRIGQPLWFLAVYVGCSAFVPLMTRLHEASPRITLGALLGAAALVDTVSLTFHLPALGAFNFLFVWLFIQQLGFWYADGAFSAPRWLLLAGSIACYGILFFLTLVVGYSKDMYENLNPPTLCILVLGVGQLLLFAFLHPYLSRLATMPLFRASSDVINRNSMTIYLWHVPVVVMIALTMMSMSMSMPEPLSQYWWETRPLFLGLVTIALIPIVFLVARWEKSRRAKTPAPISPLLATVKAFLSVAGVATILVVGFTPVWSWAIGLTLIMLSVRISPREKPVPVNADGPTKAAVDPASAAG